MKTTAKDVILICKGWYDKEKYPTVLDALKQYYRINYSSEYEECLDYNWILNIVLLDTMREIAENYPDRLIGFVNNYLIYNGILCGMDIYNNNYAYQLFHRIVNFLGNLRLRGGGVKEIDTEEYFMDELQEGENGKHKCLKEDII